MNYYFINKNDRLEYQKEYHALYRDKYIEYQRWYYQNVKKYDYVPKTKITKTFLKELEKICKRKIRDYNDTLYQEQQAKKLTNHNKAFEGFDVVNGMFRLRF